MTMLRVPVAEVQLGDLIDLENDRYAAVGEHPEFEFELQRVEIIEHETADCTVLYFENFACGFPPDHILSVKRIY